jgi:hypothetical protein
MFLARGPIAPVAASGGHHSLRKRQEPPIVIPEVKSPALPPLVRRYKDGGDVLLRARLPQLEGAATSPHRHADLLFPRRQGKKLRGEEIGLQTTPRGSPQRYGPTSGPSSASGSRARMSRRSPRTRRTPRTRPRRAAVAAMARATATTEATAMATAAKVAARAAAMTAGMVARAATRPLARRHWF